MRRLSLCVLSAAGLLASVGCGSQFSGAPKAQGGLAVIDLDSVAKSTGRTDEINRAVKLRENSLNQQLVKLQAEANTRFDELKVDIGDTPSDDQKKQLLQSQVNLNAQLNNAKREAQMNLEQYRQELIVQFRGDIRPIAHEVASAKGLGVVIPKNEGFLLSVDPGVDITSEVIHKLQTSSRPAAVSTKDAKPIRTASADKSEKSDKAEKADK